MKDKKILILIVFAVVLSGVFLFLSTQKQREQTLSEGFKQEIDIAKLKEEIVKTRDLLRVFMQTNAALKDELNRKEYLLGKEKERSKDLQARLNELFLQNDMLGKELTSTQANLAEIEELTQPIRKRFEGLESTFEGVRASLATLGFSPGKENELKRQLASLKNDLDSIDRQIPSLIKENKNYRKQADILKNLLSQKDAQIQNLDEKLNEGLAKEKEKAKELEELVSLKSTLEKKLDESREEKSLLEKDLNEKNAQIKNLENKLEEGKKQLSENDARIRSLEKQSEEEITKKNEELNSLIQARLNLEDQISQLQKKNVFLENELEQAELNKKELKRLERANFVLEQGLNSLKNKNSLLNERIVKLNSKLQARGYDKTISTLKKINQELKSELDLTRTGLEKLKNDYANLKKEYASIKEAVAQNEIELAKRAERILGFQDRLAVAESMVGQLQKDYEQKTEESASLRKEYVARQLENQALKDQLNQYRQRLADLHAQIIRATEENTNLQNRLQEISNIFKAQETAQTSETGAKKVDVQLRPSSE